MSSPEEKRRKNSPSLDALPDELLLICFASVSRLYYPTLSLVSKRFRTLLTSPEHYRFRSLLGHSENCLYVCLYLYPDHQWFTLCRKPDKTSLTGKRRKRSNGYVLAKVEIPHSPRAHLSSLVAVGSSIYNIAGSVYHAPSSSVSVLDCMSHTWSQAPSLRVELRSVSATVVDRKIYVAGSNKDGYSFEVLDTKNQTWDPLPIPFKEANHNYNYSKTASIDGKFHLLSESEVAAYDSKEGRWDPVEGGISGFMFSDCSCVIENVLYSVSEGVFRWYDDKVRMWRQVKGLVGLPKFQLPTGASVRLAGYGEKIAVFWVEDLPFRGVYNKEKMIWYAEIALKKRKSCEIWGKGQWVGQVLTVPRTCGFIKVLGTTV